MLFYLNLLQMAGKSHSASGAFYRRLRSRLGAPKAITATAHFPSTAVLPSVDIWWKLH
jgi:hypothetical protein